MSKVPSHVSRPLQRAEDAHRGFAGQFLFDAKDRDRYMREPSADPAAAKKENIVGKRLLFF
jgi:hypothetical protein